jgi:DNA-directed RNA polymerase specialized sigma subunit
MYLGIDVPRDSDGEFDWGPVNSLGRRYHELVEKGHGIGRCGIGNKEIDLSSRCDEQVEIGGEMAVLLLPFSGQISRAILNGGWSISTMNGPRTIKYTRPESDIPDMTLVGGSAVLRSAHGFDPDRGEASTYFGITIGARIERYLISDTGSGYHIGFGPLEAYRSASGKAGDSAEAVEILAETLKLPLQDAWLIHRTVNDGGTSITAPVGGNGRPSGESVEGRLMREDGTREGPYKPIFMADAANLLSDAVSGLNPRERLVISLSYPEWGEPVKQDEIASALGDGLLVHNVRDIKRRALGKLKASFHRKGIRSLDHIFDAI